MTKIRCAIAGLGRIGSELESDSKREKPATHAGVIHRHPETFIAAGCDPDSSKREHFRAQWGVNALYESLDDLLEQEKIDIVHIATPPETHLDLVRSAVQHGTQVIILEKPVASSLEEAEQIVS
jgi:predicted dehydrogenase